MARRASESEAAQQKPGQYYVVPIPKKDDNRSMLLEEFISCPFGSLLP
jgi:hypothetical protein